MSKYLIEVLRKYPLLHYAVEESLLCAKMGYYGIGILAFSQLLNQLNKRTPDARHEVAHEFLKVRPTKGIYEGILEEFKKAASERSDSELEKSQNIQHYQQELVGSWDQLMKEHNL